MKLPAPLVVGVGLLSCQLCEGVQDRGLSHALMVNRRLVVARQNWP